MRNLDELMEEYEQAWQNFEYAESEYVRDAVTDLCVLEILIGKALRKTKKGGQK